MTNTESIKSGSNTQPVIDFTTLPLAEVALMLRTLGEELLLSLLQGKICPDLATLFTVEQVKMLVRSRTPIQEIPQPVVRIDQSLRDSIASFFDVFRRTSKGVKVPGKTPRLGLIPITNRVIDGELSPDVWYSRAGDQIRLHFGATSRFFVPDDFWEVVTELAWRDPSFQHRIAGHINHYLKHRVLFARGDMPIAVLSPKIYWILICLAGSDSNQPVIGEAISRLQAEGKRQSLITGWAKFWDQWVISEALQRWPQAFNYLDSQLRAAIFELPLLEITSQKRLENFKVERSRSTVNMAIPSWTDADIPEWVHTLLK